MDIYTAIKKERFNLKIFVITISIISIILPVVIVLTDLTTIFFLCYLCIIELLIIISIIIRLNYYKVNYTCFNNKLIFKTGILTKKNLIICDKVALVHTSKSDYDLEIIIITSSKLKNKSARKIEKNFLKRYPQIEKKYNYIKKINPEKEYYFQVIRRGGLKKYLLLDLIYKNCVRATYTEESIQNIKIARGQTIV